MKQTSPLIFLPHASVPFVFQSVLIGTEHAFIALLCLLYKIGTKTSLQIYCLCLSSVINHQFINCVCKLPVRVSCRSFLNSLDSLFVLSPTGLLCTPTRTARGRILSAAY